MERIFFGSKRKKRLMAGADYEPKFLSAEGSQLRRFPEVELETFLNGRVSMAAAI